MSYTQIVPDGRILDANDTIVPQDQNDSAYQIYLAWLQAGGEVQIIFEEPLPE